MSRSQASVLVVDDDPAVRKVLRTSLAASGFDVEEARDGEQALALITEHRYDLVVLDMNMPEMSGIEVCREIRSHLPQTGIVIVTVRSAETDMVQALEAGADDYLTKPFRFAELAARLRAVLRRIQGANPAATPQLRAGDLHLDMDRRIFRRAGETVHLTPTEFDLLAFLMKNQGIPLPHAKLLREVWGPEYGEELEYLRSYIRMLRRKIEDDPAQPKYLLTEPWVGYRFYNPNQ
jgi:two-component system, OmpR family, KDP operon response regulator KdpE